MLINKAYLAGVIDSDGSISICKRHVKRKNPNYTIMIQLSWAVSENTKWFMKDLVNQYGGSVCETNHKNRFKNAKPVYRYCVSGQKAIELLNDIQPFLVLKTIQAGNAINAQHIIDYWMNDKWAKSRPPEVSDQLEALYQLNKSLNSKNGREKHV